MSLQVLSVIPLQRKRMPEMGYIPTQVQIEDESAKHLNTSIKKLDQYEVIDSNPIGEGGMGIVYKVRDPEHGWFLAAKTLKVPNIDLEDSKVKQFITEIEYLIELPPHLHIVQVESVKFIENKPYIFMEYVEGGNLVDRLCKAERNKLDFATAINYALQLCHGFQFVHEKGRILHLDIKPENILINQEDIVKISDFGISKPSTLLSREKVIPGKTGTLLYMSPEQFK